MIVVDTNVIMAFLLTKGITHQIISTHRDAFITPEYCFEEIWEHKDVWNKHDLPENELIDLLEDIKDLLVYSVARDVYKDKESEASELISDPDDVPIVALGLAVHNDGIWTYDKKHFSSEPLKARIRILNTSDVVRMYPIEE